MSSIPTQIRYVIEWFQEWSEMQRDDFVGILMERCGGCNLVNGIENLCLDNSRAPNLGYDNSRPPSIFQCRIKLFREWSECWTKEEKDSLVLAIKHMDPKFAEKYERLSKGNDEESVDDNHDNDN